MNGQNTQSQEAFLGSLTHPRKRELAEKLFNGASVEDMTNAGYSRISILEMVRNINQNVEGKEDFYVDIPRSEDEDVATASEDESAKKKSTTTDAQTVTNGDKEEGDKEEGDPVGKGDGGAHYTETVGGNPTPTSEGDESEANKNQ